MLYRRFGKTNEMVSVLGFGCMRLPLLPGGDPTRIDETQAIKLIRHAIDKGVNYVDTAYPYHGNSRVVGGQSELLVAKALKDGYREKVKLATKLPSWMVEKREDMDRLLNEQLARLETDHIDFYLVHNVSSQVWDALKKANFPDFLDAAIKDGRIRYAGFSFHDKIELFKEAVDYYDWSFCQIQYNYLDTDFQAGTEGLEYAGKKGLGITIMEPLKGGKLAHDLPEEVKEAFRQADANREPAEWALRWVWNHPEVSTVLSGMNAMEQVEENLKSADDAVANSLTAKDMAVIDKVRGVFKDRIKVDCTGCGYCMPCPSGVDIPTCFYLYNSFNMFGKDEPYKIWIAAENRASNCVECGRCEEHCPQGIKIRDELKNVTAAFE
jgi:predicted aldo/keto reductase-like oxidoreductase